MAQYDDDQRESMIPSTMRLVFGIIMIIVYVGMGILLLINFFRWGESYTWLRIGGGILFVIYGIWRAIRQIKGIDSAI
jgi:cytochrome c biogenesis protein CcdA